MGVRGDMRTLGQAIRHRWLTEDLKTLAIEAIKDGLESDDDRAKQAAIKNLLMMEAQNQKDEQHDDHIRMDEGRNRVLIFLGRDGPAEGAGLIEHQGQGIPLPSDQQPPSKPAARKNKRREPG